MHSQRSRLPILLALAALAFSACSPQESEQPGQESSIPGVVVRVSQQGEPALPASFEGIVIDILSGVKYEAVLTSTVGGKSETLATIDGHSFRTDGQWITIGPERYGPVASGDRVTIDEHGVHLNGKLAGPLPPREGAATK